MTVIVIEICGVPAVLDSAGLLFVQKICFSFFPLCVSDLRGGLVLVLSVVGLLFSQALAMLSVFFASEVMPTVVR